MELNMNIEAPISERELKLAQIWADVLKMDLALIGRETTFFEAGGDSISAIEISAKAKEKGINLSTASIFKFPTLSRMADLESKENTPEVVPYEISESLRMEIQRKWFPNETQWNGYDYYPTTPLQQNMIAKSFIDKESYIGQFKWEIQGFEPTNIAQRIQNFVNAHDILRTRFLSTSEGIFQVLIPHNQIPITTGTSFEDVCQTELKKGFTENDLHWFRVGLVTKSAHDQDVCTHVVLTIHHALFDGWCVNQLTNDFLTALKGSAVTGSPPFKNAVSYIAQQNEAIQREFWAQYLHGWSGHYVFKSTSTLTKDIPYARKLSVGVDVLKSAASKSQVTMATIIKGAWALTLSHYIQTKDVVFATVVSGRDMEGIEAAK
jgi:aryl carrier-like protein